MTKPSIREQIRALDNFAAVNLAEPSSGDLERVYTAYKECHRRCLALAESNEALVEALKRYAGRKVKFHDGGGGKAFYGDEIIQGAALPFFHGETWELGCHAEQALADHAERMKALGVESE